ncbi:hypothetical protein Ancab_040416 [Ancistrocladus abbreviatus]
MNTTMIAAVLVALCLLSVAQVKVVESSVYDCIDACTTTCVSLDPRVVARCNRKCSIKCAPPAAAEAALQVHRDKFFCTKYERSKVEADKIALKAAVEGVTIMLVYPIELTVKGTTVEVPLPSNTAQMGNLQLILQMDRAKKSRKEPKRTMDDGVGINDQLPSIQQKD